MKKTTITISAIIIILALSGCQNYDGEKNQVANTVPQNSENKTATSYTDTDYGCVKDEGYSWCDAGKKCVGKDEKCEKSETPPARSYDLISQALAKKNNVAPESFTLGINSLTLSHFKGMVSGKSGEVLARKHNNDWEIVFDGAISGEKEFKCADVIDFPADMIKNCIN